MTKEQKHFPILILLCFGSSFIVGLGGGIPKDIFIQTNMWQFSNLGYIAGCALMSLKAGSEGKHISAAGFILLSIGMGIFFSVQTSLGDEVSPTYTSGVLMFIPGILLVCYYDGFPLWVRIGGIVAVIPRLIMLFNVYMNHSYVIKRNGMLDGAGYITLSLLSLFWTYYSFKNIAGSEEKG